MNDIFEHIKQSKAILSPLAGISDLSFRLICRKYGCRFAFTEMVDAKAALYAKPKNFHLLDTCKEDSPLGVQLVGNDPDIMLKAGLKCEEMGVFSMININFACPVKKVVRRKTGVYLMQEPSRVASIISALTKHLQLPVTVKIRSGFDENNRNCVEISKISENEGAKAIFIHPRHGVQKYRGKILKQEIFDVMNAVKIPVIPSGDLFTAQDAVNMLNDTGCFAVAIARGALGNPWIFEEIRTHGATVSRCHENDSVPRTQDSGLRDLIIDHFNLLCNTYPVEKACKIMYKHILWYLNGNKDLFDKMKNYNKNKSIKIRQDFVDFAYKLFEKETQTL